jgi:hypothetical protein
LQITIKANPIDIPVWLYFVFLAAQAVAQSCTTSADCPADKFCGPRRLVCVNRFEDGKACARDDYCMPGSNCRMHCNDCRLRGNGGYWTGSFCLPACQDNPNQNQS